MKTKILNGLCIAAIVVLIVLVCYGCWSAERWLNWKYGYSGKVEERVESVEKRMEELERKVLEEVSR